MSSKKLLNRVRTLINNNEYQAHQNFFEAGGTSIQIIELAQIVYETTGKELDMTEFFSNPYIDKISYIEGEEKVSSNVDKKKPTALFLHDGSGFTESYRYFYEWLNDEFEIVRVDFPSNMIKLAPQSIDIKELTQQYLSLLEENANYEYVFGWCIGGKVAYEISKYLKNVRKVVIMNSPAPNIKPASEISYQSERDFIKKTFKIPFLKVSNKTVEALWEKVVDYYQTHGKLFDIVKNATPTYIKFLIPNFYSDKLTPEHYFKYLNLIRSFSIAHDIYETHGKVSTAKFYFFNAVEENLDSNHKWEEYVINGSSYELSGGHTDIVSKKNATEIIDIIK
ncbi:MULTISPECIES: thioesterase domain-containing protein [Streptococcus]|jgi:phosphopantetheine attachment domain protein|uniref:thioesterase domain-containing protein n=1 Tax=Streptococcus TaxID=1301 RepID=UPI0003D328ED|nr:MULTISPECIES: thioesterase domain-containing protein [Streptococcus]ETD07989.1 hypothetical protein HMPREF1196_01045 [Streptococcus sanguinis CC94A]RSI00152.1 enterobactin synthase subunit F [Streptococcus sanguinis]